jgi:hypothetical protein
MRVITTILLPLCLEPVKTQRVDLAVDRCTSRARAVWPDCAGSRRFSDHQCRTYRTSVVNSSRVGHGGRPQSLERKPTQCHDQGNGRERIAYFLHGYSFAACFMRKRSAFHLSPPARGCARNRMGPNRSDHRSNCIGKVETVKYYLCGICAVFMVY